MKTLFGVLPFAAAALAQPPVKCIPAARVEDAIGDIMAPADARFPGRIVLAGCFNEDRSL